MSFHDDDWDEKMTARAKPFEKDEAPPTPFSDPGGWEETETHRLIPNPNRHWWNAPWTPSHIAQTMFVKYSVYGEMIGKWIGGGVEEDAQI